MSWACDWVKTAAGALKAATSANLSQQVHYSRFRHNPTYWEHTGHRWRGAVDPFDSQSQISISTIYFSRTFEHSTLALEG